ncbi:transcription factor bHLH57 isoform X1 [Vigna radiata var. radiata]|uniref:Transcription factor bHLH57 isoform X1 n=2 Tax=Vigna radiata var. radiata TaxID=3916 RepID=A0A1S3VTC7_VIGRR|nr:transcription factor bHLH57 isoform X1 [Vigna radiata var. radiata]
MERLQGPLNSCFFGDPLGVNCLDQVLVDEETLRLEEEEQLLISSLEDKMPFLQMLQSVESPQFFPLKEPNFQTLLRLQHIKKPWEGMTYVPRMEAQVQAALELESCVTHDMLEMQSPVKSESNELQHPLSFSCVEKVSYECNQEAHKVLQSCPKSQPATTRERRKRKRTRPSKNTEDVENQRMTHIAVERNRRRQMNDHLSVLRSLMPPSYIQRGDQASIIGGAIDFVKELEQLLQSLEAQKRMRKNEEGGGSSSTVLCKPPSTPSSSSPHGYGMRSSTSEEVSCGDEMKAENKSEAADIKVTLIQTHVNLKIECQRKPGQLIKVIVALEDLRLTILHLNITSSETSVLYSLNLKIEEGCSLRSASDIAEAVHHIFNFINGS